LIPIATHFTGVRTGPPTDGWEGACFLDELYCFLKFSLGSKAHISLDIVVGRTFHHARRRILLFSSGLAFHRITPVTLVRVMENNTDNRINGYGIFPTGDGTGGIITMVAVQRLEKRCSLNNPHHSRADAKAMFLFAGHLTGVAATTILFVEQQRYPIHVISPIHLRSAICCTAGPSDWLTPSPDPWTRGSYPSGC